jgi:hypothetical protein
MHLSPGTQNEITDALSTRKSKISDAPANYTSPPLPKKFSGSGRHEKIEQAHGLRRICRFQNLAISVTTLLNQGKLRDD